MLKIEPKVSVVIPYYNNEHSILRALESVRNQTFPHFELILVNDGSIDGGSHVVESYMRNYPELSILHIEQLNCGPSRARNVGMIAAKGQFIAFLDADDSWDPNKLSEQVDFMDRHPDVAITGTNYVYPSGGRDVLRYPLTPETYEASFRRMLFKSFFCMPTVMVRREVIEREKLRFKEGKHYGEDLLFFMQICRKYKGVRLSSPLVRLHKFLFGDRGLSSNMDQFLRHDLDNLKLLYTDQSTGGKQIDGVTYLLLRGYCYAKHAVRHLKSWLHRVKLSLRGEQH